MMIFSGNAHWNMSFALLWGKILESSLWVMESKETRLVWITILAMKDKDGKVLASVVGLADRAKVSVEECRKALARLLSPDPQDSSKVEEGRRLRVIPGGWEVVNNDLYRFASDARREVWRLAKADEREKKKKTRMPKPKREGSLSKEEQTLRDLNEGKITLEEAAEIASESREFE